MAVSHIQELIDCGFHLEFPEILIEDALDTFTSISSFESYIQPIILNPRQNLDPYKLAVLMLSDNSDSLLFFLSRMHTIQQNFLAFNNLITDHLPKQASLFKLSALSSLFSQHVKSLLKPYLCAYLLLELLAAEASCSEYNYFTDSIKLPSDHLLEQAQLVFSFSVLPLQFLLRDLWIPFFKAAFHTKTTELISGVFYEMFIEPLQNYLDHVVLGTWLKKIQSDLCITKDDFSRILSASLYDTYYAVRRPELFSMMVEYPDSHPALLDLKLCLQETSRLQDLIDKLGHEVRTRLLHPGVHTDQILLGYGCLVRALRVIDVSSVAQDIVCQPVASCLRSRDDAVHCIVDRLISPPTNIDLDGSESAFITEQQDQGVELQRELLLPTPLEVEPTDELRDGDAHLVAHDPSRGFLRDLGDGGIANTEAMDNELDWDRWMPDPIEALHRTGLWRRSIDLLSLLVGIYGSKKAFLVEYRNLLSQRLLKLLSFDTDSQLRHLELLKRRFGEVDMQECDVMLKDIRDSRRITNYVIDQTRKSDVTSDASSISSGKSLQFPVKAFILSGEYWPEFHREQFKLPDGLLLPFENFTKRFEEMKGNRTVTWMHKLGLVNVDLQKGNETINTDVSPLQAAVLYMFSTKPQWAVRDIGQRLEVTISTVRRCIQPFIQLGILEERSAQVTGSCSSGSSVLESYGVCFTTRSGEATQSKTTELNLSIPRSDIIHIEMETSPVSNIRATMNQELQVFWSYILGMLTNLGGLSLDRIHSMLRMFVVGGGGSGSGDSSDCTRQQLRHFLEEKLRDGQLICEDDIYKLP